MGRFNNRDKDILFTFEKKTYKAKEGDSVASALFDNNIRINRETFAKKTKRGSFCYMGVCFECLVKINGISGIQACKTKLVNGMEIQKDD